MRKNRGFIGRLLGGFDAQDKVFRINARYGVRDTFSSRTQSGDVFQDLYEAVPNSGLHDADLGRADRARAMVRERHRRQELVHRRPEKWKRHRRMQ
jgi:hypothetical protein